MEPQKAVVMQRRRVTKSAVFVLLSVMFKRYSTAGIASILLLFLNLKIGYDKNTSTTIYHAYEFLACLFAIVGAIVADSCFGMYRTIVLMSWVLAAGCFTIAIGVIDELYLPLNALGTAALVIMAVGDGCLKPLHRTYGAYQYNPTEVKSIAQFFVLYYFVLNCGSIISKAVSPILRQDVKCFRNDDCFTLAFGIPGICSIIVALLTIVANRYSETLQTEGTNLLNVLACIWHAIAMKIKLRKSISKKHHWLDYADEKYGKILVWETRVVLNVIVLYLPITLFWALFSQQGSRWVLQAMRMNGNLGFYTILPDQFNVINPILVILLIPAFENGLYQQLAKVGIRSDLHKVTLGGTLAGVSFLISAVIEWQIDDHENLHMTWLIPQNIVMAMGETLVTIPMMNFAYQVAPTSMKAILQAFNNLSVGIGNLIVVIVVRSNLIYSQIYEFVLFAGLMFADMIVFGFLARRFKPLKKNGDEMTELIN